MKLNYKLGELIRNIDVKNKDLHCNNLKGLSMTKEFRASTSNIVGTDLSKYKIVAYKQFACDFMSAIRVHKMPIAFNSEMEEILVSPAYAVFEVIDENIILPEYLMMRFRRSEFDRYADFRSDAAIRGGYGWNELCETEIKLPSLEEQRKKVQAYKTITDRIELKKKINDNLAMTLSTLFLELYSQLNDENNRQFDEICTLASSKRVFANDYAACGVPFYRGKEITLKQSGQPITEPLFIETSHFEDIKNKYGVPMKGDILITAVGTIGNSYLVQNEEFYFKDGNIIWLKNFSHGLNYYVYDFMQTSIFKQLLKGICIGSTQTALTIVALSKLLIKIPDTYTLETYVNRSCTIHNQIEYNNKELLYLHSLNNILLSKLSR
jgi:type I restriction enzyme S subunit